MSTLDTKNVNNENLPRYKNSQLGVGLTKNGAESERNTGFPDFKFQKNKTENLSRQVSLAVKKIT